MERRGRLLADRPTRKQRLLHQREERHHHGRRALLVEAEARHLRCRVERFRARELGVEPVGERARRRRVVAEFEVLQVARADSGERRTDLRRLLHSGKRVAAEAALLLDEVAPLRDQRRIALLHDLRLVARLVADVFVHEERHDVGEILALEAVVGHQGLGVEGVRVLEEAEQPGRVHRPICPRSAATPPLAVDAVAPDAHPLAHQQRAALAVALHRIESRRQRDRFAALIGEGRRRSRRAHGVGSGRSACAACRTFAGLVSHRAASRSSPWPVAASGRGGATSSKPGMSWQATQPTWRSLVRARDAARRRRRIRRGSGRSAPRGSAVFTIESRSGAAAGALRLRSWSRGRVPPWHAVQPKLSGRCHSRRRPGWGSGCASPLKRGSSVIGGRRCNDRRRRRLNDLPDL